MTPKRPKRKLRKVERRSRSKKHSGARKTIRRKPSVIGSLGLFALLVLFSAIGVSVAEERQPQGEDISRVGVNRNGGQVEMWIGDRVRVEVRNAGGVAGMARTATDVLRPVGFDVVKVGNARAFYPERPSAVIDRVGRIDAARAIAKALGIDNVLSDPNPNLYVDVTVVVGSTWQPVDLARRSEITEPWPWWDPREWFGT